MNSRWTRQKELLKNTLHGMSGFFSADDLAAKLPSIGIATIYRFLREQRAQRQLHAFMCGNVTVYAREKNMHCHFTCMRCHKTIHVDLQRIADIKRSIKGELCHFQLDMTGVCERCLKQERAARQQTL
ncbi:MAG: transcriptional repressor [archaeon]